MFEPYFTEDCTYSETEEMEAMEIRSIKDSEERTTRVKCFEVERGKPFPHEKPVRVGDYNADTAQPNFFLIQLGASEIQRTFCC